MILYRKAKLPNVTLNTRTSATTATDAQLMQNAKNKGMGTPVLWDATSSTASSLDPSTKGGVNVVNSTKENFDNALLSSRTRNMSRTDFLKQYERYRNGTMPQNAIKNFELILRRNPAWIPTI